MSTRSFCSIEKEPREEETTSALAGRVCNSSALGELLPDYIAELLADPIEEEVEEHLLDCLHCREQYLKVLSIGNALHRAKVARGNTDDQALPDESGTSVAGVLQMDEFRKVRS